jgi:hypothetical protein
MPDLLMVFLGVCASTDGASGFAMAQVRTMLDAQQVRFEYRGSKTTHHGVTCQMARVCTCPRT